MLSLRIPPEEFHDIFLAWQFTRPGVHSPHALVVNVQYTKAKNLMVHLVDIEGFNKRKKGFSHITMICLCKCQNQAN